MDYPQFPGAYSSPEDARDFKLTKIQAEVEIPTEYKTDLSAVPVLYQNGQGACVGHASATAMMTLGDTPSKDFSPRYIYALCKSQDSLPTAPGTYPRVAMKVMATNGCADNSLFPNDVHLPELEYKDSTKISAEALDQGMERQIKSYARLDDLSFQGLKQAIFQNRVVLAAVKWEGTMGPEIVLTNPNTQTQHFICLYGYDQDKIYFRNSFGSNWGTNGDGFFRSSFIPAVVEAWTIVDLDDHIIIGLKSRVALLRKLVELYARVVSLIKQRNASGPQV